MDEYTIGIQPARDQFALQRKMLGIGSPDFDPKLLLLFLIYYSATGVRITSPVVNWISRAARRCEALGMTDCGRALRGHGASESGHHTMMIRDTHRLCDRWNISGGKPLDPIRLLALPTTTGAEQYIQVHENNIAGDTPWAQWAISYEIERLPITYGEPFVAWCELLLGNDILDCLEFIREHVTLDIGHTKLNEREIDKLINNNPSRVTALVAAGTAVLGAYAAFSFSAMELAIKAKDA